MITGKRNKKNFSGVKMYIGDGVPCLTCGQKAQALKERSNLNDDWLSREQVKELCEPCFNNMVQNNISKIKKRNILSASMNTSKKMRR